MLSYSIGRKFDSCRGRFIYRYSIDGLVTSTSDLMVARYNFDTVPKARIWAPATSPTSLPSTPLGTAQAT